MTGKYSSGPGAGTGPQTMAQKKPSIWGSVIAFGGAFATRNPESQSHSASVSALPRTRSRREPDGLSSRTQASASAGSSIGFRPCFSNRAGSPGASDRASANHASISSRSPGPRGLRSSCQVERTVSYSSVTPSIAIVSCQPCHAASNGSARFSRSKSREQIDRHVARNCTIEREPSKGFKRPPANKAFSALVSAKVQQRPRVAVKYRKEDARQRFRHSARQKQIKLILSLLAHQPDEGPIECGAFGGGQDVDAPEQEVTFARHEIRAVRGRIDKFDDARRDRVRMRDRGAQEGVLPRCGGFERRNHFVCRKRGQIPAQGNCCGHGLAPLRRQPRPSRKRRSTRAPILGVDSSAPRRDGVRAVVGYFLAAGVAALGAMRAAGAAGAGASALSGSRFQVWLRPKSEMPR